MLRECENDDLKVDYEITDESFDHQFGREKRSGFKIEKVEVWVPAMEEWMDFTHKDDQKLWDKAMDLVEKHIAKN